MIKELLLSLFVRLRLEFGYFVPNFDDIIS